MKRCRRPYNVVSSAPATTAPTAVSASPPLRWPLLVALACHLDLRAIPREPDITRDDTLLYAETASRFVVTVPPQHREAFYEALHSCAIGEIGYVLDTAQFMVIGLQDAIIINSDIMQLKEAWQRPLRW